MSGTDKMAAALIAAIGKNDEEQGVTQFIDTGYPLLNFAISGRYDGGLPFGRLIEMFGESSSGKTAMATWWMICAQKMGGIAIFIDWERSFDVALAESMGLDTSPGKWIYKRPRTWEEGNIIATKAAKAIRDSKLISDDAPIMVVFDSIASAIPASVSGKSLDELTMNDTTALARVTSTTLKHQAQFAGDYNATYLYLNQIRLKVGVVFGDPRTTPGGKAMEYYSTVRIALARQKITEEGDSGKEFVGQNITAQVVKSKLTPPFKEANIRMLFDEIGAASFDMIGSLVEDMIEKKKIPKVGKMYEWEGGKYFKSKLIDKLNADPDAAQKLMGLML